MILNRSLKIIGYAHATLLFAMVIPLLYALAGLSDPAGTGVLYIKCLLVLIPVIVTERAIKCIKNLAVYIVICVLMVAGVCAVAALFYDSGAYAVCYYIGMSVEIVIISIKRLQGRLKESPRKKAEDPFAAKEKEFLDTPSLLLVWYFAVIYVFGLCLNAKALCDIAFYSAIIYLFLALIAAYFRATESYLEMNKRIKGIPTRRLYGVSFSMLLLFVVLLLIGILPSVFLTNSRRYIDIKQWVNNAESAPYEYQSGMEFDGWPSDHMDMMELLDDGETAPEPPAILNTLFWIIGGVCVLAVIYGILRAVRQVFCDFRNSRDENGDIIEELEAKDKSDGEERPGKGIYRTDSAAERIKRRYRKMIRKHRKDRPAPYESPAEIEKGARLKDDEQMQQLHIAYEEVRYGKCGGE